MPVAGWKTWAALPKAPLFQYRPVLSRRIEISTSCRPETPSATVVPQKPADAQPAAQPAALYEPVPGKVVTGVGTDESGVIVKELVAVLLALSVTVTVFDPLSLPPFAPGQV